MAIIFCDGFDHYDGVPLVHGKVAFPKDNDTFGFTFHDEAGDKTEVTVERQENGSWEMIIDRKVRLIFNQRPTFLATMLP